MELLNWEFHVSIVIDLTASVPPSMLYALCGQRLLCFRNYAMAVLPSSTCGNRVMFLCRYKFGSSGHGSWSSRSCLALFGDCLHCKDLRCRCLWPMHLHCLWQCSSLIATASEIVFWYVCNMQNLCFIELSGVQPVCLRHMHWQKPTGRLVCSFHSATCDQFSVHLTWLLTPTILWALCLGCWCMRGASCWMPYSALSFWFVVSGVVSSVYAWYYIGKYRLLKLYRKLLYQILSCFIILQFYFLIWTNGLYIHVHWHNLHINLMSLIILLSEF